VPLRNKVSVFGNVCQAKTDSCQNTAAQLFVNAGSFDRISMSRNKTWSLLIHWRQIIRFFLVCYVWKKELLQTLVNCFHLLTWNDTHISGKWITSSCNTATWFELRRNSCGARVVPRQQLQHMEFALNGLTICSMEQSFIGRQISWGSWKHIYFN